MKARKCDRCGKFYDDYKPTEETKNANAIRLMGATQATARNTGWYDLCEDCMKDLVTLLDTPPETQEEPVEPPTGSGDSEDNTEPVTPTEPETSPETPTEGEEGNDSGEGT